MTNDYKNVLLDYLTGNLVVESRGSTPIYTDFEDDAYSWNLSGSKQIQCTDGNGVSNGKEIRYTFGGNSIQLVDSKDMSVIKNFTTFSSGTALGNILALNVDENGNVYGIDYIDVGGVTTFRIILLNNISEVPKGYNDYQVILRNSYYIQGYTSDDDLSTLYDVFIKKSTQSATYYFALRNSTGELLMPSTFQINVGSANTWTRLQEMVSYRGNIELANIYFNENDIPVANYYVVESDLDDPNYVEKKITKFSAVGDGNPTYSVVISNVVANYFYSNLSQADNVNVALIECYPGVYYMYIYGRYITNGSTYHSMGKVYYVSSDTPKLVKTYISDYTGASGDVPPVVFKGIVVGDTLLSLVGKVVSSNTMRMYMDLVSPNNKIDYLYDTGIDLTWTNLAIARISVYNVYDQYIIHVIYRISNNNYRLAQYTLVYSDERYNGIAYIGNNALIPSRGMLFDVNNKLLFARGLYNKKIYNNQTMATINVPNNMLNNVTIVDESLYGQTGIELVDNSNQITKNVYENVYINFVNAISMQNQNTANYSYNLPGASRLNLSCGKVFDYEEAKANKIRVTYDDNTYYVTTVPNSITNGVCTYEIGVHVPSDKNILKIEIISNDEITTYQTITNLNLTNNKYYQITQDVYVV